MKPCAELMRKYSGYGNSWNRLMPCLASCVEKRDTALKKLPWRIVKKKGL